MTYLKSISDEFIEPITLLGLSSLAAWTYAENIGNWLNLFESHQVALTGFTLFIFSVIKKYYQLKAEREKYLKLKNELKSAGQDKN